MYQTDGISISSSSGQFLEPIIASGGANTIRMTGLYFMGRVCLKKRIMNLSYSKLDGSGRRIKFLGKN